MKILFDYQIFTMQRYGGISRYFQELHKRLNTKEDRSEIAVSYTNNAYLDDLGKPPFFSAKEFPLKNRVYHYLNKRTSLKTIKGGDYDILHPTYYNPYFLKDLKGKPFVVSFFDMIHEKFAKDYIELEQDRLIFEHKSILAEKASKIIAISESTKKDMVEIMHLDPVKIEVIHLGSSFNDSLGRGLTDLDFRYLLFVGNRSLYKNFKLLVQAIAPLLSTGELRLVCAGGGFFTPEESQFIDNLGLNGAIMHKSIDDNILASLYRNAIAFIFPSLYEGFGIPVLEAFSCGCPCLLSNTSSLPEVGGEAALYFDPYDMLSIYTAVENIITNAEVREKLKLAGKQRLKIFSWDKMYNKTRSLYLSLV